MRVEIEGSVAHLWVLGDWKLKYDFGEILEGGQVGVGSRNGQFDVDRFHVVRKNREQFEFIELSNESPGEVSLAGWHLAGSTNWVLPADAILAPQESLLVVSFDPGDEVTASAFRRMFAVNNEVTLVGPYHGLLGDGGASVRLLRPHGGSTDDPFRLVDAVSYRTTAPWPEAAAGGGASLHRKTADAFGNLATNWFGASPGPGEADYQIAGDFDGSGAVGESDLEGLRITLADPTAYEVRWGVPATLRGDADSDGDVDFDDIQPMVARVRESETGRAESRAELVVALRDPEVHRQSRGVSSSVSGDADRVPGDADGDGDLDFDDLAELIAQTRVSRS
jgi:hypothetical protein